MASQRPLTLYEKLDYIPALGSIRTDSVNEYEVKLTVEVGTALYSVLTAPFRGERGANTYGRHVLHSVMRKVKSKGKLWFPNNNST